MAEHRVPMLGAALRRHADPARSRDPQVRELVSALATLEVAPAPRADFRAELRAQLVAVTPRLVEEGKAELPAEGKPAKRAPAPERQRLRLKKPLIAAVGVLTAFILLLGGAVLLSQNSLPGDALYGLKRASENTEYGLAGSSVDKGKLKLEFAARRIGEVGDLLSHAGALAAGHGVMADGGTISTHTAGLVSDTLHSADSDITSAAQLLGDAAVHNDSAAPLDDIISWAPGQLATMDSIVGRMAGAALHAQAVHTRQLIANAKQQAEALKANLGSNSTPGTSGKTGTPSKSPTGPSPRVSSGARTPASTPPSTTAGGRTGQSTPTVGSSSPPGTSRSPNPSSSPTPTKPPISLPVKVPTSLPGGDGKSHHTAPTPPVGVDSCGVHATLGPIGIGVGGC